VNSASRYTVSYDPRAAKELSRIDKAAGDTVTVKIETPWLSPAGAAALLNVSRSAVQKWIEQGKIATERHGTYHRIPVREVERYRAERIRGIADSDIAAVLEDMLG
jgi:excisionase family DNA binding protein